MYGKIYGRGLDRSQVLNWLKSVKCVKHVSDDDWLGIKANEEVSKWLNKIEAECPEDLYYLDCPQFFMDQAAKATCGLDTSDGLEHGRVYPIEASFSWCPCYGWLVGIRFEAAVYTCEYHKARGISDFYEEEFYFEPGDFSDC